ncbi:mannose-6-phosphate isomerase, class I [Streptacidiphilus sp. EB129]|uniref:mannose-6-phosphate isomerase, class I n=1 Tax=Streptacidiphilus sp. EB129 TaxID=3156262 RepID=UPI00351471F8
MDRLTNTVRPYAWGSRTLLPSLLGTPPTGEPQAELWMGAHPGAPSVLDRGTGPRPLDQVIAADPEGELGEAVVGRFGPTLPFLLKVLAAGEPLSLQVHPDLDQARAGFAGEESRGVPVDAPNRNYKDANHKPELICAVGEDGEEFVGLCGFRDPLDTARLLDLIGVPALAPLSEILRVKPEPEALREVLTSILTTDQDTMACTVQQTVDALDLAAQTADAGSAAALRSYAAVGRAFPGDPGVIAALLLNHIRLQPGEALYLGAGVPHAYLSGIGVEILANSDNVVRCGLTPKHVDIPELLHIVDFRSTRPAVLHPVPVPGSDGEEVYPTPIDEFRLSRFTSSGTVPAATPQILLCTGGTAELSSADGSSLTLRSGESVFIPAGGPDLALGGEGVTLFRATVSV